MISYINLTFTGTKCIPKNLSKYEMNTLRGTVAGHEILLNNVSVNF